jgi:long-subunit acyl-CoA synthetase (AMP-forming)
MVEAGVMAMRPAWSKDYGSVGRPLSDVQFVIGEGGEVFVHRPQFVALRYFQCAQGENERTFPEPGMIATGDVGQLNEKGWLSLFGRKKEVITTAAGAKIHPEVVEKELLAYPGVAHAVLHMRRSDGRFICIIDLADPEDTVSRTAVAKRAASPKALRTIAPFVEVRFSSEPFSTQNGMLRPNLKIDRKAIVARHAGD